MSIQNISLSVQKRKSPEIIPNTIMSAAMEFFSYGLKNEFKVDVVYEPSECSSHRSSTVHVSSNEQLDYAIR